jgi:hypothetical protein
MFKRRFRLPSPALVISMITLSLVLGGTAFAAATAKHADAKADTKLVKKLAPTLSVKHAATADSATSATNATNAANATHATSATAATAPGTLASGHTEYGTIGSQPAQTGIGAGDEVGDNAELPFPAPVALDNAHVQVAGVDAGPGQCTGTAANPTAAAGYVCIYPYDTTNASVNGGYVWGGNTTKYGFQLSWNSVAGGYSFVFANWAYTAP